MDWTPFFNTVFVIFWFLLPLLAGAIAHRKGRSWIVAVLLSVVVPPLGVFVASFQSARAGSARQASTRVKLLFGLLPLWAGLVALAAGGVLSDGPGYWQGAPWIIVFALPACAFTLALVELVTGALRG